MPGGLLGESRGTEQETGRHHHRSTEAVPAET
jgi:hypothetical protein